MTDTATAAKAEHIKFIDEKIVPNLVESANPENFAIITEVIEYVKTNDCSGYWDDAAVISTVSILEREAKIVKSQRNQTAGE